MRDTCINNIFLHFFQVRGWTEYPVTIVANFRAMRVPSKIVPEQLRLKSANRMRPVLYSRDFTSKDLVRLQFLYFLQPEKSTLSLWKLITFYPNKQIWPNTNLSLFKTISPTIF